MKKKSESSDPSARKIMKALQFLYYVESKSIWSDYHYDAFCKAHGLDGSGGSDLEESYTPGIIALARGIELDPDCKLYTQPKR